MKTCLQMDVNTKKERKVIFLSFQYLYSSIVCYLYLQCFMMFWQFPYVDLMKCEVVIQQMKRGARVIPTIVNPLNFTTPTIVSASVGVMKKLTRSSQLDLPRCWEGTTPMSNYDVKILEDTRRVLHTSGILPSTSVFQLMPSWLNRYLIL